mmetsp:Transcript_4267/g.12184  ORF Transcript_4267/g.12184 Transcript_4267/m.12184 type:complete len:143 (+) Transcript_4267:155-583(+)
MPVPSSKDTGAATNSAREMLLLRREDARHRRRHHQRQAQSRVRDIAVVPSSGAGAFSVEDSAARRTVSGQETVLQAMVSSSRAFGQRDLHGSDGLFSERKRNTRHVSTSLSMDDIIATIDDVLSILEYGDDEKEDAVCLGWE